MDERQKQYIIAGTGLLAGGLLFLVALNVNNPFASNEKGNRSYSFLHRFVALQLLYFSTIVIVRELLAINVHGPLNALDHTTVSIINTFSVQFKYSVFNIVIGILALDFDGGFFPGLIFILRGLYLIYPTVIGGDFGDGLNLQDLKNQTVGKFNELTGREAEE